MQKQDNEIKAESTETLPLIQLIVFKLGTEEYGIRIDKVKEVTITPEITKMPKTPNFIKGVANVRGDIIAVMDLVVKFGLEDKIKPTNEKKSSYILVVEIPQYTIGIIVHEVPHSLAIPVSSVDKTPNVIQERHINENFIEGIGKTSDGRLVIVLDILNILSIEEIQKVTKNKPKSNKS